MLGKRHPADLIPAPALDLYFAWQLADRRVQEWHWILENLTVLDVTKAYAMKRLDFYQMQK